MKYTAKKPFKNYVKGDTVKEEDAKRFGSLYCAQSGDASFIVTDTGNETGEVTKDADSESDIVTTETDAAEETEIEEPNLDELSYPELKALADSKGIEYSGNIKKTDLIELLIK